MTATSNGNGHAAEADDLTAQLAQSILAAEAKKLALPEALRQKLYAPLPPEAIQAHPTKAYLSTIKTIYAIDRLNEVFGIGGWSNEATVVESAGKMIVMKVVLEVPRYGIHLEQYGGNDNDDRGDAYKGAVTDALGKLCGYLGIGMDVYKGGGPTKTNPSPKRQVATQAQQQVAERKIITMTQPPKADPGKAAPPAAAPTPPVSQEEPGFSVPPRKPWSTMKGMIQQFQLLKGEIPWPMYYKVLADFGVEHANQFKLAGTAWACYQALYLTVQQYLKKAADPRTIEHFEAQEGDWQ